MKTKDMAITQLLGELCAHEHDQAFRIYQRGRLSKTTTKREKVILRNLLFRYAPGFKVDDTTLNWILRIEQ